MKDMYGRIMIDVEGTSLSQQDRELISNGNVGGIILFSKNFNSFEQISDLVNEIHAIKENILLAVDQEGGRVQRFSKDFTQLPSLQDLAKYSEINNDPDICKEVAWLTSSELIAAGIDLNFAPVLDIDESDSAIIGDRSFSSKTDDSMLKNILRECMRRVCRQLQNTFLDTGVYQKIVMLFCLKIKDH